VHPLGSRILCVGAGSGKLPMSFAGQGASVAVDLVIVLCG
jgi:2-polyprenyl-3-methyl-5-hydroxy-6-metoxy-1,4-benzoquinol methylase